MSRSISIAPAVAEMGDEKEKDLQEMVPADIRLITEDELKLPDSTKPLGREAFGVVYSAALDSEPATIKKMYLSELNKKQKRAFVMELGVMAKQATCLIHRP